MTNFPGKIRSVCLGHSEESFVSTYYFSGSFLDKKKQQQKTQKKALILK